MISISHFRLATVESHRKVSPNRPVSELGLKCHGVIADEFTHSALHISIHESYRIFSLSRLRLNQLPWWAPAFKFGVYTPWWVDECM